MLQGLFTHEYHDEPPPGLDENDAIRFLGDVMQIWSFTGSVTNPTPVEQIGTVSLSGDLEVADASVSHSSLMDRAIGGSLDYVIDWTKASMGGAFAAGDEVTGTFFFQERHITGNDGDKPNAIKLDPDTKNIEIVGWADSRMPDPNTVQPSTAVLNGSTSTTMGIDLAFWSTRADPSTPIIPVPAGIWVGSLGLQSGRWFGCCGPPAPKWKTGGASIASLRKQPDD